MHFLWKPHQSLPPHPVKGGIIEFVNEINLLHNNVLSRWIVNIFIFELDIIINAIIILFIESTSDTFIKPNILRQLAVSLQEPGLIRHVVDVYWTVIPVLLVHYFETHPASQYNLWWSRVVVLWTWVLAVRLTHNYFCREKWQWLLESREDWRFTDMAQQCRKNW